MEIPGQAGDDVRKLTNLTVMPDLIGHLKIENYDRKSDLPYGIRGFHDDV